MVHAVRVPAVRAADLESIYFVMGEVAQRPGWTIEPGAWLEVPINVNAWPQDMPRPDQVLCRSLEDPRHYKIYKYRDEFEEDEWQETGLHFGGTFSPASWEQFAEGLPADLLPLGPDNNAEMDEVMRRLRRQV